MKCKLNEIKTICKDNIRIHREKARLYATTKEYSTTTGYNGSFVDYRECIAKIEVYKYILEVLEND